jgi:hypothetical protein
MRPTEIRLEEAKSKIHEPSFLKNKGLGNEVGYYIFDYPPKDELIVREWVKYCHAKNNPTINGFTLMVFDLYDSMLEIFENEGCLEQFFTFEGEYGLTETPGIVSDILRLTEGSENLINKYICERIQENTVVLLTGVGKCYPVLRAHTVLNNLHQVLDQVPVVMLYPGGYDGQELVLFGSAEGNNYYRAFRLVGN